MCGRYVLKRKDLEELLQRFGIRSLQEFHDRFNVAPTTQVPAIRASKQDPTAREAVALQWGLVPRWAKDAKSGAKLANARAEGIADKPAFRHAFRQKRCAIPASGFYEWQTIGKLKQPWYFKLQDGGPLLFAGLWESWQSVDGVTLETCALITTSPNAVMTPIHDRMPVILHGAAVDTWLDPRIEDPAQLAPVLQPLPAELMATHAVSPQMNSVRYENPDCIAPAEPLRAPEEPQLGFGF